MTDLQHSFFEAAILAFAGIQEGDFPALGVSVALVHAHQVCCPQGGLLPTCACPHLQSSQYLVRHMLCLGACNAGGGQGRGGGAGPGGCWGGRELIRVVHANAHWAKGAKGPYLQPSQHAIGNTGQAISDFSCFCESFRMPIPNMPKCLL